MPNGTDIATGGAYRRAHAPYGISLSPCAVAHDASVIFLAVALLVGAAAVSGSCGDQSSASAKFRQLTIPEGTALVVRLGTAVASDTSHVGDPVDGALAHAVLADGTEVLPVGSLMTGHVTVARPSGKVSGLASLAVRFETVAVEGQEGTYAISAGVEQTAAPTKGDDAKKIAIPATAGAGIGALVGGKKGAGIGALVGGGAGTAVVLDTSGSEVRFASGTVLSLTLDHALDVRVAIRREDQPEA